MPVFQKRDATGNISNRVHPHINPLLMRERKRTRGGVYDL